MLSEVSTATVGLTRTPGSPANVWSGRLGALAYATNFSERWVSTHISTYGEQAIRSCYHDSFVGLAFLVGVLRAFDNVHSGSDSALFLTLTSIQRTEIRASVMEKKVESNVMQIASLVYPK